MLQAPRTDLSAAQQQMQLQAAQQRQAALRAHAQPGHSQSFANGAVPEAQPRVPQFDFSQLVAAPQNGSRMASAQQDESGLQHADPQYMPDRVLSRLLNEAQKPA